MTTSPTPLARRADAGATDDLDDRQFDIFRGILSGRADVADHREYERTSRALHRALCADEWPQEDTDAIVGPLQLDHEAIEAWYERQDDIPS